MNNADTKSNADENASAEMQQAVGQLLREAREQAGLEIAEVARVLRISKRYLVALEDGRDEDLPGTTYAIGFARSYAEHLKLDGEEVVRRYKAHAEGTSVKTDLTFPKPIPDSGVPGAAVLGLGIIVAGIAYGAWYWNSNNSDISVARVDPVPEHMAAPAEEAPTPTPAATPAPTPAPTQEAEPVVEPTPEPEVAAEPEKADAPTEEAVVETVVEPVVEATPEAVVPETVAVEEAVSEVLEVVAEAPEAPVVEAPVVESPVVEATPEPTPEPAVVEEVAAQPVVSEPAADDGDSRITVRAKSNSWIQIRDEALDRLLFTRLLREGDEYVVPNRPGLRLMTGNAGALELLVDGTAIPAIGAIGEVRRNVEMDPDKLKSGTAVTD